MVEWTDEAMKAAIKEWDAENCITRDAAKCMRAALDAAVKEQGGIYTSAHMFALSRKRRNETLEEAAKVIQPDPNYSASMMTGEAAAAIRALIEPAVKK